MSLKFNRYLTDTESQFCKVLVISVKYWISISLYELYRLNIGLLRFLPLVLFNRYLTNTNQYILETNIIDKISQVLVKYWFIPFSIFIRFNQYLTNTYRYILKSSIIG